MEYPMIKISGGQILLLMWVNVIKIFNSLFTVIFLKKKF